MSRYAIALAESIALLVRNDQRPSQGYSFPTPDGFGALCDSLVQALANHARPEKEDIPEASENEPDIRVDDDEEFFIEEEEPSDELPPPVSPEQALTRPPLPQGYYPEVQTPLRKLMIAIYTQLPQTRQESRFFSLLYRYLVLAAYHKDGSWKSSLMITQDIAALLFCGRLTIYSIMDDYFEGPIQHEYVVASAFRYKKTLPCFLQEV